MSCYACLQKRKYFKEKEKAVRTGDWGQNTLKHRNGARVVASAHVIVSTSSNFLLIHYEWLQVVRCSVDPLKMFNIIDFDVCVCVVVKIASDLQSIVFVKGC